MRNLRIPHWGIEEETGYKPLTTFWQDFSIADAFGVSAVKDTYKRATSKDGYATNNYKALTELVMVLNHKISQHYQHNDQLAQVYNDLWEKADALAIKTLKGDELSYFYRVTD